MKDYDKNKQSSHLNYWDVNNLYGWARPQKLPVNNFEWIEETSHCNEDFIKKTIMKKVIRGIFLMLMFNTQKEYINFIMTYHFYLKERNLKIEKLVTNLCDINEYVIHIGNLKQTLNYGLILKRIHRKAEFNQKDWLKPCIVMNTKLRQKAKNNFEKDTFKLMKNSVFGKTMENVRKDRDIKLVTTERRRDYLVSEPNYHTTKLFIENLFAIELRKTEILMNRPVYYQY